MSPKSADKFSLMKRIPKENMPTSEFGGNQFSVISLILFDALTSPPISMIGLSAVLLP